MKLIDEYIKTLEKELKNKPKISTEETGIVSQVKDGVVILEGLDQVAYGELIEFKKNVLGYVIDLTEDEVGAIILGDYTSISAGDKAKALGYTLSVPVSEELLGRVVDSLGSPLDGKTAIKSKTLYPVEKIAAGVVKRQPVNVPLQTGIKSIDALIPIGRGQRELIIGDRGTGKTTIAIDTILNQKGENVVCIYCAI